jgi:ribosomal protein L11 methyltransferase
VKASHDSLWKLSVTTSVEAEEAVAELLGRTFGQVPVSYCSTDTGAITVSVYLGEKPNWSTTRANLEEELGRMERCGLRVSPGKFVLTRMPRENWAESWKRHFRPLEIGRRLLVKPSWSARRGRRGQAVVVLDPGLSFGTGQHPTTAFCLDQLTAWRIAGKPQSCLDIGTGSGILAIAAAKLGYRGVEAIDVDAEAVRVARANARRNRVAHRIRFRNQDLGHLVRTARRKHSVICANLMANLLLSQRDRIIAPLEPGGLLVLAGILKEEFAEVQGAYQGAGVRLKAARTEKEWRSGSFVTVS